MKAFLSSTYIDLIDHRKAATEALERLGHQVGRMEIFGARPEEPKSACLSEIEACDMFVGLYAHRYGYIPRGSHSSITEQEFEHAKKHNKPLFCFLVDEDHPWPPKMIEGKPGKSKLQALKTRISGVLVKDRFTTPEDLAFKIATSIGRYLSQTKPSETTYNPYIDLLGSSADLVGLLEKAVRELESITKTDYNQVFLVSTLAYSRQLVAVADVIPPHKQRYRIATFSGLLGSTLSMGKTINARNVRERPNYFQAVIETESELVVPIARTGAIFGVLNSESEDIEHYDDIMQRAVEQLASALGELLPDFGYSPGMSIEDMPWVQRLPW